MSALTLLGAVIGALLALAVAGLVAVLSGRDLLARRPSHPAGALGSRWRALTGAGRSPAAARSLRWRYGSALPAGLLALWISGLPVLGLAAAVGVIYLPAMLTRRSASRQAVVRLTALEGWVRRIADLIAAHAGLEQAIIASARTIPSELDHELRGLITRLSASWSTESSLRAFAVEFADPAGDMVAAALILASRRRGPQLSAALRALATSLAEDVTMRGQVEAEREKPRTTARWLTVGVLACIVFVALSPHWRKPYQSVTGELVLALACGFLAGCFVLMWRMTAAPPEGRFLAEDRSPQPGAAAKRLPDRPDRHLTAPGQPARPAGAVTEGGRR